MSEAGTTQLDSDSSTVSAAIDKLAADIRGILDGPEGESSTPAPLTALLTRLADIFGADDACICWQEHQTLPASSVGTSQRARRLGASLLEGRWFARRLDDSRPLVLRRGAADLPIDADHERHCLRAAGIYAMVTCAVPIEGGITGHLIVLSRHSLNHWITPVVDQLPQVATLLGRAALWSLAAGSSVLTDVAFSRSPARSQLSFESGDSGIVGSSDALRYVMFRIDQVAPTTATVLLLGETGTGKELMARAIHDRSPRHHRNFIVVNCGALPAGLIESELFGRERGAFTGAHNSQAGLFEVANGGTLFLDEIGELPLELQPKLLRVLQEGQLQRLGSTRTTSVDVRVVAATNRNLADDVQRGTFRRDLFYRLNVFPITLPTLRERLEDLPTLVHHLVGRLSRQLGKSISQIPEQTLQALAQRDWPGNIRELENVLQQAIILSRDGILTLPGIAPPPTPAEEPVSPEAESRELDAIKRRHICAVLASTGGRIEGKSGAAAVLGLRPSTLRSLMLRLGIPRGRPSASPSPAASCT